MKAYSEIYYYNKKGEIVKLKDCEICKEFLFDRQNFILLLKNKRYYICIESDLDLNKKKGVLFSFWGHNIEDLNESEVISLYRSEYKKHKINNDLIISFIKSPIKQVKNNGKRKKKIS